VNTQQQITPLTVGVESAYRSLGIGRTAFYALVRAGEIRLIKLGKRSLVPCAELERLVADRLNAGSTVARAVAK
jgi:excisionase family DNA binding protein